MAARLSRRDVLRSWATALGFVSAGCLGFFVNEDSPSETDASGGTARPGTTTSERTTIPAADVSGYEAEERALAAEETFLAERFRNASCLTNWGVSPKSASARTNVTERTAEGVRVEVTLPFHYSTDDLEVDGASNALYVVTVDSTERVRGDEVSPC